MARLFRRKSSMLRRRSFVESFWLSLSPETRSRSRGLYNALSIHMLLFASLYAIGIAAPSIPEPLEFFAASSEAVNELETFTLEALPDPVEQTIAEINSLEQEVPEPLEDFDFDVSQMLGLQLDEPGNTALEVADVSDDFLSELTTDSQRVAEADRRVKAAGGNLKGALRISLIFSGTDDIDLHVHYAMPIPRGQLVHGFGYRGKADPFYSATRRQISYRNRRTEHGVLDVDANAAAIMQEPCENVVFASVPTNSQFVVGVHHYRDRDADPSPVPFVIVIKQGMREQVFKGAVSHPGGMKVVHEFRYRS